MFSSWLPLSDSSLRIVSFLMHLGVFLFLLSSAGTPDLGNEGHGAGALVLLQELALSCWNPNGWMKQGDALAQGLKISLHPQSPKWCWILAGVGYVLIGLSRKTPTVGSETHHASTKMCHLVNFQWFSPFRVVGEQWRAVFLLSHFIGCQSRQGIVKDRKKVWGNQIIVGEEFAEKTNTSPVKNCEQIECFPWSFPIFSLNDSKLKHAEMWLVFKKTAFVREILFSILHMWALYASVCHIWSRHCIFSCTFPHDASP